VVDVAGTALTVAWLGLAALALVLGAWWGRRTAPPVSAAGSATGSNDGLAGGYGEAVLDCIPLGVVVAGVDGAPVFRNAAADALVDSWEDGVVGRLVAERLLAAAGGTRSAEQVRMPGNPLRVVEVVAESVSAEGAAAVVVFDDVTERHRQEAVRRDFVANVSHELKTPIGALSLLAETLADERSPEVVDRLVARVGTEAQRVAAIVDDLLDLSRIEEAPPGRLESVDLASVVGEVADRVGPTAERRHIALDVEVPVGVGVAGSRSQLLSLVRNLVENAVKYSDGGTTVAVRVSRDADDAVVEVVDRGIGIPAADLDRVFERFYRVDRARTRETGGSGLGLSIVRHVVQAHGGTVRLASTEGEGTTVTVRLPAGGAAA